MNRLILYLGLAVVAFQSSATAAGLSGLKKGQLLSGLQVQNLYVDSDGATGGAKFLHTPTGAPIFFLQLQTVPQVLTWIDTPSDSNQGLPHALEHLLLKGKKGRSLQLLEQMHLDQSGVATWRDFVCYGLSSGSGRDVFFDSFHALLAAGDPPELTDVEARRGIFHFGGATDQH